MNFKWIFLFVLIGLPVSIYLFLQAFGENRFDVAVFHQQGVEQPKGNCTSSDEQHMVSAYPIPDTLEIDQTGFRVIDLGTASCDSCLYKINNLISINEKFKEWDQFGIVTILNENNFGEYPVGKSNWDILTSTDEQLINYANCELVLDFPYVENNQIEKNGVVVLVDDQRRIRGYYNVFDRKESDRLSTELDILNKNAD